MAIYLDNNATTKPLPEVTAAMGEMLADHWHNPSAVYRDGQAVRQRVDLARKDVAALIGAKPRAITFTGSGTEAIDLAVRGYLTARRRANTTAKPGTIITTPIEHSAVRGLVDELRTHHGFTIRHVEMDAEGVVIPGSLNKLLTAASLSGDRVELVSIQWANNETGAVHPIARLGEICRAHGVAFHCDATQWVGKMPVGEAFADFLTFSPHKFHGPKGVGVVYARPGLGFSPLIHGEQEQGRRGGTENTHGIVGAGVACRLAAEWLADPGNIARGAALRDRFERGVLASVPDAVVNGPASSDPMRRLWNTTNIAFPRLEAEALLLLLSEHLPGVCCSAGAACSSGALEPSPVLRAMGIAPETAHGALRFSTSRLTTADEIDEAVRAVNACVERLRASMV